MGVRGSGDIYENIGEGPFWGSLRMRPRRGTRYCSIPLDYAACLHEAILLALFSRRLGIARSLFEGPRFNSEVAAPFGLGALWTNRDPKDLSMEIKGFPPLLRRSERG